MAETKSTSKAKATETTRSAAAEPTHGPVDEVSDGHGHVYETEYPGTKEPRPGKQGPDEFDLSDHELVQRRTPGGDRWPADGKFRWVFHVAKPVVARNVPGAEASSDWSDEDGSMASMHEANKVATLQYALGNGCHPTEAAELDQVLGADDEDAVTVDLVYAVASVPAGRLSPEDAPRTYTPSKALGDLGGTTLAERETHPEGHLNVGQRDSSSKE
jgi:hypothetical protein